MKIETSAVRAIPFQAIPIGGRFEFRGRRYCKLALSLAGDEDRNGNSFQAQTEVLPHPLCSAAPPQAVAPFRRCQRPRD